MTAPQTTSASYEVGYRKPPRHTQFQKGQSGNPGGRPRRSLAGRLEELALHEAYRTTVVMEDGHAMPMPVIQAVLRRQIESAAGGNVRAQRDILAMIRDIERARSVAALFEDGRADDAVVDDDDVDDTDDADANDGDDNDVDGGADADHHDAGGADDDEPARQQANGIDTHGERQQEEREPTAPTPAVSAPPPENAAAAFPPPLAGEGRVGARAASSCRGKDPTPALHPKSGSPDFGAKHVEFGDCRIPLDGEGEESRATGHEAIVDSVEAVCNGPGRSAGVQHARPQPGRRRGPAVNPSKIRGGRSGGLRRSPGRTKSGPDPAQAAGGRARAPAAPAERDKKLKTRC
jgi:hypothetical protein